MQEISPIVSALVELIKERFPSYKFHGVGTDNIGAECAEFAIDFIRFRISETYIIRYYNTPRHNFDIADPKFDPEDIIVWISRELNREITMGIKGLAPPSVLP